MLIGSDSSWDLRNYHLYNPYAFVEDRIAIDIAPAQLQSYHNPLADLPFYLLFTLLNDHPRTMTFILGFSYGICLILLGLIAFQLAHLLQPLQRWVFTGLVIIIGSSGAATVGLIGSTVNEMPMTMFLLASMAMIIYRITHRGNQSINPLLTFFIAGMLAGIPAGLKPTYGILAFGIGMGVVWLFIIRTLPFSAVVACALGMFVSFLAVSVYWMLTLYEQFGNPLFPYFNDIFKSSMAKVNRFADTRFIPGNLSDALLLPFTLWTKEHPPMGGPPIRDLRVGLAMISVTGMLLFAVIKYARSKITHTSNNLRINNGFSFLVCVFVVSYFLWVYSYAIYRYILVLEILSSILIIYPLFLLVRRPLAQYFMLTVLSLTLLLTTIPNTWNTEARMFFYGRNHDNEKYIDVNAPEVEDNSLVFLVGPDPMAFFIPFMNPSARFIGIHNNFLSLNDTNATIEKIHDLVAEHDGEIYAFISNPGSRHNNSLDVFNLKTDWNNCKYAKNNIGPEKKFCTVQKL